MHFLYSFVSAFPNGLGVGVVEQFSGFAMPEPTQKRFFSVKVLSDDLHQNNLVRCVRVVWIRGSEGNFDDFGHFVLRLWSLQTNTREMTLKRTND